MRTWRKFILAAALSVAGLVGIEQTMSGFPACRFLHYYREMAESDRNVGAWERVVYSLILAGAPAPEGDRKITSSWERPF